MVLEGKSSQGYSVNAGVQQSSILDTTHLFRNTLKNFISITICAVDITLYSEYNWVSTVKLVYNDHLGDKDSVVVIDRWSL